MNGSIVLVLLIAASGALARYTPPQWNKCPRKPQHWKIEVLLPHEECNKFYQCTHGKPVAFECPANLLFNVKTDLCDWPQYVDCKGRILPEEPETENVEPEVDNGPKPVPETEVDAAEPNLEAEVSPDSDAPLVATPDVDVETEVHNPKLEPEVDGDAPLVATPEI